MSKIGFFVEKLDFSLRFWIFLEKFEFFMNILDFSCKMRENSVKCGKVRERLPTSTLRRGKVPKGRPARAPTSTADRGTKKNECTKGAGAEGARTLCAGGGSRPSFSLSFRRSAVEVGALAGRHLGTFAAPQVSRSEAFSCIFPALHTYFPLFSYISGPPIELEA